ncbi:MFS transporter (plasmid) [Streptomyces sp. CA-294286]|uniref:MFS transporter n=1 Tax=Streptomyces sp. CA-294286 TaxID=3240070 RepID=UPI003D8EADD1
MSSAPSSPFRSASFRRLWWGQSFSQFGSHAGLLLLPLLAVLALDADADHLGALRAVEQAPVLLLSLFAGAWVDRLRPRDVMVSADAGRALALVSVGGAYWFGVLGMETLFVVAFLMGTLTVFFDVAYQSSLVQLVRRDQLTEANSALEGSRSVAQFGGPALGGGLLSVLSVPVAALVNAAFFVLSLLALRSIKGGRPGDEQGGQRDERGRPRDGRGGPRDEPDGARDEPGGPRDRRGRPLAPVPVLRRIRDGVRHVVGEASLRAVALATALFQFSFAALMTVYLVFLPRELGLSPGAVGLVLGALGPGAVVGSLLAARLPGRYGYGRVLVGAAVLGDGMMLCVPALHGSGVGTVLALAGLNFLFGALGQLVNVAMMSVRQALTPVRLQGRVVATVNFVGMGLTPLGSLLGGWLAGQWGLRTSLLVTAASLALSPLFMTLSPLARLGNELPSRSEGS